MKIINPELLAQYRGAGRCEYCRRPCASREPHHLWSKGMGGGGRLDIPINLIALGSTVQWQCDCHRALHDGHIHRADLLAVVAEREGEHQKDITAVINFLRRLDKHDLPLVTAVDFADMLTDVYKQVDELNGEGAVALARKTMIASLWAKA